MDNVIIINKISPDYDSSKLQQPTFENKVDVFEDRMKGWMVGQCLNRRIGKIEEMKSEVEAWHPYS